MDKEELAFDKTKFYGHPMFYEILKDLANLHSIKNYQYAQKENPLSNFDESGELCKYLFKENINKPLAECLALNAKQITAVYSMIGTSKKNTEEQIDDKLRDCAVYFIIAMILWRQQQVTKTDCDCGFCSSKDKK